MHFVLLVLCEYLPNALSSSKILLSTMLNLTRESVAFMRGRLSYNIVLLCVHPMFDTSHIQDRVQQKVSDRQGQHQHDANSTPLYFFGKIKKRSMVYNVFTPAQN